MQLSSIIHQFSSVQFSRSVVSNSLQPHELQHARPPCPSPTPRDYLNSCSLSWWCHPTVSSSVVPFSSRLIYVHHIYTYTQQYDGASGQEPTCQCRTEEMQVQDLGRADPLVKEMTTHSSILAWRIPWTEEPGGLQSMGSQRVRHDWSHLAGRQACNAYFAAVAIVQSVSCAGLFVTHGLQHTRPPCPLPTPGEYSNSCPSSQWYHPTISSSVTLFSWLQSFRHPSIFRVFSNELVLHIGGQRYWSFSL